MFSAGAGVFFPEPEFFLPEPEPEVKNPEFAQHYYNYQVQALLLSNPLPRQNDYLKQYKNSYFSKFSLTILHYVQVYKITGITDPFWRSMQDPVYIKHTLKFSCDC